VFEVVRVQVAVKLAVEHVEQIAIEGCGDAGVVVVGADQSIDVLHQVSAQQQAVTGIQCRRQPSQEVSPWPGGEVADRAAEEDHRGHLSPLVSVAGHPGGSSFADDPLFPSVDDVREVPRPGTACSPLAGPGRVRRRAGCCSGSMVAARLRGVFPSGIPPPSVSGWLSTTVGSGGCA